jgi:hypothetical protein
MFYPGEAAGIRLCGCTLRTQKGATISQPYIVALMLESAKSGPEITYGERRSTWREAASFGLARVSGIEIGRFLIMGEFRPGRRRGVASV